MDTLARQPDILLPKYVGETDSVSFDFTDSLDTGETLAFSSVAATVWDGTDSSPSAIISGSSVISTVYVIQKVTAGTANVWYLLLCTATTSLGRTLQSSALLPVVRANQA